MHLAVQMITAAAADAHLGIKQGLCRDAVGQRSQVGGCCHKLHRQVVVLVKHCCAYVAAALLHKKADALDEHLQGGQEVGTRQCTSVNCQAVLQSYVTAGRLTEQANALDEQHCPLLAAR